MVQALADGLRAAGVRAQVRAGTPADWQGQSPSPIGSIVPADEAAVQAAVETARARGVALLPRGGGTQDGWGGPLRRPAVVLDLTGMEGVVHHEPGDLTVRLLPGTRLRTLAEALRAHRQAIGLAPPGWSRATVGGAVAGDAWGACRLAYGAPRDLVLGLRVVDGTGRAFATGGHVVKNVSGLDVGKLFVGSFGTLGVLTEVTCKLRPLPGRRRVWAAEYRSAEAAWEAVTAVGTGDFEPVAAALVPGGLGAQVSPAGAPWGVVLLLEGSPAAVDDQLARLARAAGPPLPSAAAETLLHAALEPVAGAAALAVRCEVPEAHLRELWSRARAAAPASALALTAWLGLGTLWCVAVAGEPTELAAVARRLRAAAEVLDGRAVVTCARGLRPGEVDPWGDPGELLPWFRRLKERFDPDGVLSPGRFVGGI